RSRQMRIVVAGAGAALVVAAAGPLIAQEPAPSDEAPRRVLSARDTLRINQVGSPVLSPDGEWVVYTVTSRDMDDPDLEAVTHLWRVRVDGTGNRQLTRGSANASAPAWSPDGSIIAFLAARGDEPEPKAQVHFLYADGGEAWPVTGHDEAVRAFSFAPDGSELLLLAQDGLPEEEEERRKEHGDAEVVDGSYQMTHLWLQDIGDMTQPSLAGNLAPGPARRLTEGDFTVANPDWSPDSRQVAFETRPNPTANDGWRSDIRVVDVETGEARLLHENGGSDTAPRWSPDGSTIAFASNATPTSNTLHSKLYLAAAGGDGPTRVLLDDFDRNFTVPTWAANGRQVFWPTGDGTSTGLFRVSVESGAVVSESAPGGRNSQWELSKDGTRWVWVHTSPDWPAEIYTAAADGEPVRLTDANAWLRDEGVALGAVETVRWTNGDGETVEGVLTKPVGYEEGSPYPFIVNPHGGPTGASLAAFSAESQFFAGNGYVVLQPNFRGSTNYGQAFISANIDNWGITDYDDVMTGVDHAVAMGWADPERLICYGWSYGGYLSAWIVTQTDRFRAVSPGAALTNLYSMYSTNDIQDYLASFFGGTPWAESEKYRRHSPMTFAADVTSPVLLMHGAADTRVPPEQSVEFYRALRDLGKDVTFVRFPREGHGIREPLHQVDRLRRYAEFFGEHVDNPPVSERQPREAEPAEEDEEPAT
ncbi:MAG: S9 family peptidase, partial [Acidobacteria bacterium]|nr:S9 family peptidase [Acidobacteriota bacterium]